MSGASMLALLLALQAEVVDFGPAQAVGGASVRRLKLPERHDSRAVEVFFSRDGESLYFGEPGGRIRVYSTSDLAVRASVRIPTGLGGIALSRSGLVAFDPFASKLRILDPSTLEERRAHTVGGVDFFATGPALDFAFVTRPESMIAALDLESGRITRELRPGMGSEDSAGRVITPEGRPVYLNWGFLKNAQVSPDGKYFFCANGDYLYRLSLTGDNLHWEEAASFPGAPMQLSPDGRLVLFAGGPRFAARALNASHLQEKAFVIPERHGVLGLAADASGERIFAAEGDLASKVLSVGIFDAQGTRKAGVEIQDTGRFRGRLAAHPGGKAVAVPLDDGVIWVAFQGAEVFPREGLVPNGPAKRPGLAGDAASVSDDELARLFVQAQFRIARDHLRSARFAEAEELFTEIVAKYPKSPEAEDARRHLEVLRNRKKM